MKDQTNNIIPLIKEIKAVAWYDSRYYLATTFADKTLFLESVTTVTDEVYQEQGIRIFRERVGPQEANRIMEEAGRGGDRIHHACSIVDEGQLLLFEHPAEKNPDLELKQRNTLLRQQAEANGLPHYTLFDQREMECANRYEDWLDIVQPEIIYSEYTVWSLEKHYAGRVDRLFRIKEGEYKGISGRSPIVIPSTGYYIIDIKSGNESIKHKWQVGAYRKAHMECRPNEEVLGTILIYLDSGIRTGIEGVKTILRFGHDANSDANGFNYVHAVWQQTHPDDEPRIKAFRPAIYRPRTTPLPHGFVMPNEEATKKLMEAVDKNNDIILDDQLKKSVEKESKAKGEAPEVPAPVDYRDLIRAEILSVYQGKNDAGKKAQDQLIQRAFAVDGKPTVMTFVDLAMVSNERAEKALEIVKKDVASIKDRKRATA